MFKPSITWTQFAVCNENPTKSFEDMCRRLFIKKFLDGKDIPHSDHNNPGIEVLPILEPKRKDSCIQKRISFQCKYVDQSSYAYTEFKKSAKKTAELYKGQLDLVYLFCNKTLTTSSKSYKEIVKIHKDANIETKPICNDAILDMVLDYQSIAEYYFQIRPRADITGFMPTIINGIPAYYISTNNNNSDLITKSGKILEEYIYDSICKCKNLAQNFELKQLKDIVTKLISYGVDNDELYFYKCLILIYEEKDISEDIISCNSESKTEIEWLRDFWNSPIHLSIDNYESHIPVIQIFVIHKMFVSGLWNEILYIHDEKCQTTDANISNQFELYYGLSLLNLQKNERAKDVLHTLYENTKEQRIRFFEIVASIRVENSIYLTGKSGNHDLLANLYEQLETMSDLEQYSQQALFVDTLKLETCYHLGIMDKKYLEKAIVEYERYSKDIQNDNVIRFYYALCLERNCNRDKAINIYNSLDWKNDPAVAERYMINWILLDKADTAINIYNKIKSKTPRIDAIYLSALCKNNSSNCIIEVKKAVEKSKDSLSDLINFAFWTDDSKSSREILLPEIKKLIQKDKISELHFSQIMEIIVFLAHCKEITIMANVIDSIEKISDINSFVIIEIYKALLDVVSMEDLDNNKKINTKELLDATNYIAEKFEVLDTYRRCFLQVKALYAKKNDMPLRALLYFKELFEISHDLNIAYHIVLILLERHVTKVEDYKPYIELLIESEISEYIMLVAWVMDLLGRNDMVSYYAYKALFLLNDKDDYNVYWHYFCLYNKANRLKKKETVSSIKEGSVVTLEEDVLLTSPNRIDICIDPESEYDNDNNKSMGIDHITRNNTDFMKFYAGANGQLINFKGKKYKIVHFISRNQYGYRFVFNKINDNQEYFQDRINIISTENIDEMISRIKHLSDNSENINNLLSLYHFGQNGSGLPIDSIVDGNYSKYIDAVKYLLYGKNEAFYAGHPIYEHDDNQTYVIGLATLVLLAVIERMDILDKIKDRIIIPESYIPFICEEYSKAIDMEQASSVMLSFIDDKPIIFECDKSIHGIWQTILQFCSSCRTFSITDQERIDFMIDPGLSGEQIVTGLGLSMIQLDSLILSYREKVTFLCDDMFLRRIADYKGIRNVNIVSIIQYFRSDPNVASIITKLSMTNYIYVPFWSANKAELAVVIENLMNGEKKKLYYSKVIKKYCDVVDSVLEEFFGRDFVDKMNAIQESIDFEKKE